MVLEGHVEEAEAVKMAEAVTVAVAAEAVMVAEAVTMAEAVTVANVQEQGGRSIDTGVDKNVVFRPGMESCYYLLNCLGVVVDSYSVVPMWK